MNIDAGTLEGVKISMSRPTSSSTSRTAARKRLASDSSTPPCAKSEKISVCTTV